MDPRTPTSEILAALLVEAPGAEVTPAWIVARLHERSFGLVLLLVGLVALVPGASPVAGLLLLIVAAQMLMARAEPILPGFLARRRISTVRLARLIGRLLPVLRRVERLVRPRWRTPFEATKRAIGLAVLLLAATLFAPIPFSHVIPALVVMMLAFAFLEEDGVLLALAVLATLISLAITAAAAWGTISAGLAI